MAKSLEEHMYRSAKTKGEYLTLKVASILKGRLQCVAHGLELQREEETEAEEEESAR